METINQSQRTDFKGWVRVLLFIPPYFFALIIFYMIGGYLIGLDFSYPNQQLTSFQRLGTLGFTTIGTFLMIWLFMKFVDKEPFLQLGFHINGRLKDFVIGNCIAMLIIIFCFLILMLTEEVSITGVNFVTKELILLLLLFALGALVEETLVRGYILKNFMLSFNRWIALILSSVLFSLMHAFNSYFDYLAFVNLFLLGMVLGISYIYTKNLWFPIGVHFSWNLFQSLLGFNVSGQEEYAVILLSIQDINQVNGGLFGLEGSYLITVASIITLVVLRFYFQNKTKEPNTFESF
jgi:membrane protease YdiL (CAAX protease family)